MKLLICLSLLAFPLAPLSGQTSSFDPAGVLSGLTVARFSTSGALSIQSMTSDAAGNIYVAGTTSALDFPVKNAAQPAIGEALLMRSVDRGVTWQGMSNPPVQPLTVTPHPSDPKTVLIGAADGIYKTSDGGRTWRHVFTWSTLIRNYTANVNIAIDATNPFNAYAFVPSLPNLFIASSDDGESWQARRLPYEGNIVEGFSPARMLWVDPNGSGTVGLGMFLSRDHGVSWSSMSQLPVESTGFSFTVPDPWHEAWIYASKPGPGTSGHLFRSKNWGVSWAEIRSPTWSNGSSFPAAVDFLALDSDIPDTLYAIDHDLAVSNDAAASWSYPGTSVAAPLALLSRQCGGGALLSISSVSFDFGLTWQPSKLTRVIDAASGPGCALYAVRQLASDAFVAKLGPGGKEVLWSTYLGGSDPESSTAVELDSQGNVYVAGATASADFPSTTQHSGTGGRKNVFSAKFDPDGRLIYSTVLGGEAEDVVTALSVNIRGEAHLAGYTNSKSFPVTPGAFHTEPGFLDGFAVKLASDGSIVYASYLPDFAPPTGSNYEYYQTPRMVAAASEASGSALYGGNNGKMGRMSPDGSSLSVLPSQAGPIFTMKADLQGNIYIAGQQLGTTLSGPCFQGYVFKQASYLHSGDIFVTKLSRDTLQQSYLAKLHGECQSWPGTLQVSPTGEATLSLWTYRSFPLLNPVIMSSTGVSVLARLNADGSEMLLSTHLVGGQAPAIALAADGSTYFSPSYAINLGLTGAAILQVPAPPVPGAPTVTGAFNAFSGATADSFVPGELLTITGQNFSPVFVDLGLNDSHALPKELGGIHVLFGDIPADMFQAAPDHVIFVAPSTAPGGNVQVRVVRGAQTSVPFIWARSDSSPGLLTVAFPNLPAGNLLDGNIRNADGSQNDSQHPAPPGSVVTLFATGLAAPGPIGLTWNPSKPFIPPTLVYQPGPGPARDEPHGIARHMPGFIDALYAVDVQIPGTASSGRNAIGVNYPGIGIYVK